MKQTIVWTVLALITISPALAAISFIEPVFVEDTVREDVGYSPAYVNGEGFATFASKNPITLKGHIPEYIQPVYRTNVSKESGLYIAYFNILDHDKNGVGTSFILVSPTETNYEIRNKMEIETWRQWQRQAGSFEASFDAFMNQYYYTPFRLVCNV